MRGLIRTIGIDGDVLYIWGGNNNTTLRRFIVPSTGSTISTFRVIRALHDSAPANPHFSYHAVVRLGGVLYDPSYGLSYGALTFDETANNTTPQQTSLSFPTSVVQSGWMCPH